jgi:hypothetical protein
MPTSNGSGLQQKSASERRQAGILHMAALMNHWLGRSRLSHDQMVKIVSWGLGELGGIDGGMISRMKNAKQVRGASWKHLDALAAANVAIWLWQEKGPEAARAELGPPSSWSIRDEWLDNAVWLPLPDEPDQPLRFAAWAEVLAGYRVLQYLATANLTPNEARQASDRLAELLEATIAERGWGPREAIRQLLEAYNVSDKARQRRLQGLIVGELQLSREELEAEMHALAEMLRVVRGLKVYGQPELRAELLSDRPPHP